VTASRLLRLAVAVGLTAYVLWSADPAAVAAACRGARLEWIGAAIALVLLDRTLMALRWIDLLGALTPGSRPRFSLVLRIFFVSSFVSNFVPSVAADMYRAYALAREDVHLAESTASVLMDRVLGVLSVVLVAAAALPFARVMDAQRSGLVWLLGLSVAGCVVAGLVVFSERAAAAVVRVSLMIPVQALHQIAAALTDAVRRYSRHHAELSRVLVMSVLVQLIRVLQAWCLGQALGLTVPLAAYFALVPIIVLIIQIPITVNGLGTAQLAFEQLFVPLGAPAPQVFAVSVLFLALGVIGTLPGALLYLVDFPTARPAA
jgi:glycosyltransferase 2 family protein